jgi:hypothetical protein
MVGETTGNVNVRKSKQFVRKILRLPPPPPDFYWSHVILCTSCNINKTCDISTVKYIVYVKIVRNFAAEFRELMTVKYSENEHFIYTQNVFTFVYFLEDLLFFFSPP